MTYVLPADKALEWAQLFENPHFLARSDEWKEIDLAEADRRPIELPCADLSDMDLSDMDLRGANLEYADLRGADLRSSRLKGANLEGAKLAGTLIDEFTTGIAPLLWPDK